MLRPEVAAVQGAARVLRPEVAAVQGAARVLQPEAAALVQARESVPQAAPVAVVSA